MNGYLEYLAKTVPVISTRQTVINISQMGNIMGDMIYLENGYKTGWQQSCTEDYMGILNRYADDRKNNIPSVVFIACDSIELAKKCSAILSIYYDISVNDQQYILVHGGLGNFFPGKSLDEYTIDEIVWTRPDFSVPYYTDRIVVCGHTPTQLIEENDRPGYIMKKNNYIAIDCGACFRGGRLAAICLDTGEEFYV